MFGDEELFRKGRRRSKIPPQKRLFRCPVCGALSPATKQFGRTEPGHIKCMWCWRCKEETDHIQID